MSNLSMTDALIAKLYKSIMETASYTCDVLIRSSVAELASHDPSFSEIQRVCEGILGLIRGYSPTNDRISQVEEVVQILEEVVYAISRHDNALLVDCTCHLEQFLEMHVRTQRSPA